MDTLCCSCQKSGWALARSLPKNEHLERSVIFGLTEARVLKENKEMSGQTDDNETFNEIADCPEMTLEGSMKGICPVCRQSVEVIESCVETLDIHHLEQGVESKLCPGSGTRPTHSGI